MDLSGLGITVKLKERKSSLLLLFFFELTQKLNIGISLLLDPNPKLNPRKKKI
jgi:hypothetical protein